MQENNETRKNETLYAVYLLNAMSELDVNFTNEIKIVLTFSFIVHSLTA